ncbi:MAG: DUF4366 domain-containing protein, partial [Lachnospiraceae bacterium]|nr:DUF4366 domain-containing protein [Lachnospiraceae bacterium]
MKKMKLSHKTVLSLVLSAVLLCMPVAAFAMNEGNAISVQAEDLKQEETTSGQDVQNTENVTEENATEDAATETTEDSTETEESTVSGNDIAEPVCICEDRCGAYDYDKDCEVCAEDYRECEYKTPNVRITINQPQGWYNDSATVTFGVKDIASTGNFEIAMVQAKVGQNGSWSEVTEDMELEVSENCTVYVLVTDQKGNTYEKNRSIRCFDTTRPTLNAAVSDGLLSVQVHDTDSGAKAVYVNGYEFTNLTNGTLNIRLQQFDAGYQYFTISALDNAGNMSEVYKTANPYYKDPADESDENPAKQLPESAEATKPGNATAIVTEYTKTDGNGNATSQMSAADQKKQAFAEADRAEQEELGEGEDTEETEQGKEFYTIQTATDKVFYLIIDRDGEQEMVYFLTEITENDLLNVTSDNSETLPKNSAALESAIPVTDSALPNNNTEPEDVEQTESLEGTEENTEETEQEPEEKAEPNPMISYVLIGGLAVAFIGGAYYFKVVRKKKEDFIEDEDEDEEDEEEVFENEDEDESEDDFFDEDQQ